MFKKVLPLKQRPGFRDMMQNRVHEILLISSLYDAFKLEEDGRLGEMIFTEYQDMNLSSAPRITRVSTGDHALRKLRARHYDLVITMTRISDMDPFQLGQKIKKKHTSIPVILLASNRREYEWATQGVANLSGIDRAFIWHGDSNIFTAIIKYIEDRMNAPRDILKGGVRAIIVVEDSPKFYSIFLPMLYRVIINTTHKLMKNEYNDELRLLRMRSRPKILLATTFEEATALYRKYKNHMLAVITDVRYPRNGILDPKAGAKFIRIVQKKNPSMPVMMQSMEGENEVTALELGAYFLDKNSPHLIQSLQDFTMRHCGFGDLIFGTKEGKTITKVRHLNALSAALSSVPMQSIRYHARRDHFSNWLAVRGHFDLADYLKPINIEDFENPEDFRDILLEAIESHRARHRFDKIGYFNIDTYDPSIKAVRIGGGSIGGKARGLAFLSAHMRRFDFSREYTDIKVDVPQFAVIATDIFDRFLDINNLRLKALAAQSNKEIDDLFRKAVFPGNFTEQLHAYLGNHSGPLAVRSSSLLEDSLFQPFAGIYSTYMLPNCAPALDTRIFQLMEAIKLVYASGFHREAIAYLTSTGNRPEDEKMAVVIQHLTGRKYDEYYYPSFSGVIQTLNYYPQGSMLREEGMVTMCLGLGRTVVNGERALKFNPKRPDVLPQFFNQQSILNNSQSHFYALEMTDCDLPLAHGENSNLTQFDLKTAEEHGSLEQIASVYSFQDGRFRESLFEKGPRIITFANILKWKSLPLANILADLMEFGKLGMGCEVEMEFAVNLPETSEDPAELSILQIRPMVTFERPHLVDVELAKKGDELLRSEICLGNGDNIEIRDLIYIDLDIFDILKSRQIAQELREINRKFSPDKPYLLVGPGRWGTADPMLGIPVNWNFISNARSIVEVGLPDLYVEPSFGSHFFQNITSLGISYFTIPPHKLETNINHEWFNAQTPLTEMVYLKHFHFERPFIIQVDGIRGKGHVWRPGCCDTSAED
ncbi:MAG: PEP/pyruvate-binding domain-containing protein [Candidatus Marinimicrobia bacterium]|nr:PEP/pyruvate-binding domain-containing protein [Candidatus Neomarinimicrobiota bacterium]